MLIIISLFLLTACHTTHKLRTGVNNVILPGTQSLSLETLDPTFRSDVEILIERLESRGYSPRIMSTYRSNARQGYLKGISVLGKRLGLGIYTNAGPGESCHNTTGENGRPASQAIDLHGYNMGFLLYISKSNRQKHVDFFRVLDEERRKLGLCWGGDFGKKKNSLKTIWTPYGIGNDPPHVVTRKCCN
jgi:hypothetical protein